MWWNSNCIIWCDETQTALFNVVKLKTALFDVVKLKLHYLMWWNSDCNTECGETQNCIIWCSETQTALFNVVKLKLQSMTSYATLWLTCRPRACMLQVTAVSQNEQCFQVDCLLDQWEQGLQKDGCTEESVSPPSLLHPFTWWCMQSVILDAVRIDHFLVPDPLLGQWQAALLSCFRSLNLSSVRYRAAIIDLWILME